MTTPEHQARLDVARKPPFEMEGAPTSTQQVTSPVAATVEKYANGDLKTVADDGDITYSYQGRDVQQYCECFPLVRSYLVNDMWFGSAIFWHQRWHGYHVFHGVITSLLGVSKFISACVGWQSGASHAERRHSRSREGWQQVADQS